MAIALAVVVFVLIAGACVVFYLSRRNLPSATARNATGARRSNM